jgi:hypothetical protein
MTMTSEAFGGTGLITRPRSNAASDSAARLRQLSEEIRKHLLSSLAVSRAAERAITDLKAIRAEAAEPDWNGYGAKALDPNAYANAQRFLEALPTTAPVPEVSADQDGEVALDWDFGHRKALTISIGPSGRCSYAWLRGKRTYHGTEWLDDEIPSNILRALDQLVRDAQSSR